MDEDDRANRVKTCYDRLISRGHTPSTLLPLFKRALTNARKFLTTSTEDEERMARKRAKQEEAKRQLYLHVEYHPQGPKSSEVQKLFNNTFLNPPGKKPFNQIGRYGELPIDKLIAVETHHEHQWPPHLPSQHPIVQSKSERSSSQPGTLKTQQVYCYMVMVPWTPVFSYDHLFGAAD
ncbi:hypothetical protein THAOC_34955 [Thalassiosira oceanica]|uniref:Uncharacterized protein n=1 Tax=Thalassiosira oceanica TaxID=159749 RepID=K0RBB1_THAOC|nr:hypothetical protein THAOC_34955 [Thalassiosira oceanica]|eukprot:EJK46376.1 hypothetical protein THAOC_34955 [Thalassiosira oceanica]